MPFDQPNSTPQKIAIIGGGISGMGSAYKLIERKQVTLFEAEPQLGGHAIPEWRASVEISLSTQVSLFSTMQIINIWRSYSLS